MIKRNLIVSLVCIISIVLSSGCTSKKKSDSSALNKPAADLHDTTIIDKTVSAPQKGFVCIADGLILRESPVKGGKRISTINLGEMVTDLDSTSVDFADKKREYIKIRLSDGTSGWAPSYGLKKDAIPAVFKTSASLYKRPDHLTITDSRFIPMEFVIILNTQDDWYEVFGDQGRKNGWIKKDAVTTSKEDITSAILITKKMGSKDTLSDIVKMKQLIETAPYPSSEFIDILRKKIEDDSIAKAPKITPEATTNTVIPESGQNSILPSMLPDTVDTVSTSEDTSFF